MSEQFDKDKKRQKWLLKELEFWKKQYYYEKEIHNKVVILQREEAKQKREDNKKRISELIANISETHKEQLEEIFNIIRENKYNSNILIEDKYIKNEIDNQTIVNMREDDQRIKNDEQRIKHEKNKKNRIELYQKYLKIKDIETQIIELEQKLNNLKSEII